MKGSNAIAALLLLLAALAAARPHGAPAPVEPVAAVDAPGLAAPPDAGEQTRLGASTATPTTSPEQRNAGLLVANEPPGRDLVALTKRLRLKSGAEVPSVVNPTRPDYKVGTRHEFRIADLTSRTFFTATATIRVVTDHAYWYVKDGYTVDTAALRASGAQFEKQIYPTNRRAFGPEINPGVDNDPRITVLVAPVPGVGGYFSSADAYPRIVNPYSNERDMIYLATLPRQGAGERENYFEATLAHEFQHMIHWNHHPYREVWFDEGSAEIAMYLNGYDVGGADVAFALDPDTQLTAWDEPGRTTAHYGASYLFLRYLMDRFGGESLLSRVMDSSGTDIDGLDSAIRSAGYPGGFDGAFQDWTVANVLNDPKIAGGRYAYTEGGRVQPLRTVRSYPATRSETVHQYAADYIAITGRLSAGQITFKGSSTARIIAAEPQSGQHYWYGNRRDSGDSTLTREFDLRSVRNASLNFRLWFDTETAFDYGYVEASTDSGATWDTLRGRYTSTANPNGNSYGNAWTGFSGSATGPSKWVEESVDLSRYAGKRVLVRFESITDEGYNRPGIAIDDIRVPEIGFKDDAESEGAGWRAEGFVRIGSKVPQRWYVALIEKGANGAPNRVREMAVKSDGTGTLDLPGIGAGASTREAVLVIAALAPKTTELANYTVTVRPR